MPAIADASVRMTQPLVVTSLAGPTDMDPAIPCLLSSLPVVSTTEWSPSSRAAPVDQSLQWSGSSFGGESAGRTVPQGSLTSHPTGASPHVGDSDADRVSQTCLERALLMSTRTVRTRVHRRAYWMTCKVVNTG